eukprot:3580858-Pleurochrysis_carterae.AAC.1
MHKDTNTSLTCAKTVEVTVTVPSYQRVRLLRFWMKRTLAEEWQGEGGDGLHGAPAPARRTSL